MQADPDDGAGTPTQVLEGDGGAAPGSDAAPLVEQDMLVEDVSIDGMCGVY